MIIAWMIYIVAVSVLVALAASLSERLARERGWATRWPWAGALAASTLLPLWSAFGPRELGPLPATAVLVLEPLRITGDSVAEWSWEPLLIGAWIASSLGLLVATLWGMQTLRSRFRTWRLTRIDGSEVWLAADVGPAVVGVLSPRIVLPTWLVGPSGNTATPLDEPLRLALAHEREHLAANDVRVLFVARLVGVAMPWNPVSWWMLARLRQSIETDCDARVLRSNPGRIRDYCETLLSVGARQAVLTSALALTEPRSNLERRIETMTRPTAFPSKLRLTVVLGLITAVAALACFYPDPDGGGLTGVDLAAVSESDAAIVAGPTFTPFTVRPDLKNIPEVRRSLEAEYPPLLREAGIGGQVTVFFLIDRQGEVVETRVEKSSGHPALDQAALKVASAMEFTPALNRDERVMVWVAFPITFSPKAAP